MRVCAGWGLQVCVDMEQFTNGPHFKLKVFLAGGVSRRRDCHFAATPLPITIETPTKGREGGAAE